MAAASSSNSNNIAASDVCCYSCEICGLDSLTEDEFRVHTHTAHVHGHAVCPFCELAAVSPAELILHVNRAHLDFLTPDDDEANDNDAVATSLTFIDDASPSSDFTLTNNRQFTNNDQSSTSSSNNYWNNVVGGQSLRSTTSTTTSQSSSSANSNSKSKPINNINLSMPKVNGGGEISPKNSNSSHGHGSPLRSSLALKLKNTVTKLQCPMCNYTSASPNELEEHVNRRHFDLTSPSIIAGGTINNEEEDTNNADDTLFSCPLCVKAFDSAPDLELHVNIEHRDVLSPANSPAAAAASALLLNAASCPVCGVTLDVDPTLSAQHVDGHFPTNSPLLPPQQQQPPPPPSGNNRGAAAALLREREQREFEMLRAQYGMDNQGNFREQSVTNMQRAVYAGEMSVADYYERTLDLKAAESCGIDDGSSITRSIVPRVRAISTTAPNVIRTLLCTCVDHYASSYGDRGWGCGYRNTQMLLSSLLTHTGYNERLYKLWQNQKPPRSSVPSISCLQSSIEQAWSQGFDVQGSEQLGCRLVNTRKWIGATEVVTLLSFLRIRCQLIDFHRPTGPHGTHPDLFNWVVKYFENSQSNSGSGEFTPPLYLQHQGHSRTIMGVEVHRDGNQFLLVLDPSHSPQQMAQFGDTSSATVALRLLRRSEAAMKARQYQIVGVVGMIDSDQQYQQSKILRGIRIPQDR